MAITNALQCTCPPAQDNVTCFCSTCNICWENHSNLISCREVVVGLVCSWSNAKVNRYLKSLRVLCKNLVCIEVDRSILMVGVNNLFKELHSILPKARVCIG